MKASTPRCFQPLYSESCSEGIFGAQDNPTTVDKYMIYANIFTMFRIKILFCVCDKERDESSLTIWMEGTVTIMMRLHKAAFFLISLPLYHTPHCPLSSRHGVKRGVMWLCYWLNFGRCWAQCSLLLMLLLLLSCCNFKIDSSVCWTITMQSQAHRLVA